MLPGLQERVSPMQIPYDSRILRFRPPASPDLLRDRLRLTFVDGWSSASTPTTNFPGSDLLYGGFEGAHRQGHGGDDITSSDMAGYERDRQRLRDLELGNKRPTSRSKRPSYSVVDKVSFDHREHDDTRSMNNSLPAKPPVLRSNGIRNSLIRGEQLLTHRNVGSNSGREPDDLIAMGTLWSPANNNNNSSNGASTVNGSNSGPTRSSSNSTASNKPNLCVAPTNNGNGNSSSSLSNNNSQRKPISMPINSGRLGHSSSFNGLSTGGGGRVAKETNKEVEPKYSDPLIGATASFQQRLMELAALEAETIRWERTKKVKKKPKQDRDS